MGYATDIAQDRLQAVIDGADRESGPGSIIIYTASYALVLAEFILQKPCATITGRVLTFSGLPIVDASAAGTGTAAIARLVDGTGTMIRDGMTVGTSGTDIIVSNASISETDQVTLTSATITHPN